MPVLEDPCPLSESKLWTWQREYYEREGVDAWSGKVPFQITSNPAIADSYAQIIVRFLQDCLCAGPTDPGEPFYVVELGAGHGAFGFHTLRRLIELRAALGLEHVPVVYVMTDLAARNLEHWRSHPGLAPLLAAGQLDVAAFDIASSDELVLLGSGRRLAPDAPARRPMVVIANYVFDTVPQDYFRLRDGLVEEGLLGLTTPDDNLFDDRPLRLDQVTASFSYREARLPRYGEPSLDALLDAHREIPGETHLLFPVGALRCLERLAALAGAGTCLLLSDKGYVRHRAAAWKLVPSLAYHDNSFSLPVNVDVLRRWALARGGEVHAQLHEHDLVTAVLLDRLGVALPETGVAIAQLDTSGYATVFTLAAHALRTRDALTIDSVLPLLAASRWDPKMFSDLLPFVLDHVRGWLSKPTIADLRFAAERVAERYYPLPNGPDTLFEVGHLLQELGGYEEACGYYRRSLALRPEADATHYNLGVCRYFLDDVAGAVAHFEEAVRINPKYVMARGWIAQIAAEGRTAPGAP